MGRYRIEVVVPITPERAFALWIDPFRAPQWQEMLERVFDLTGDVDVPGATYRLDYGTGMKRTITVLASRPAEMYRTRGEGTGYTDDTTISFEPHGSGTRLLIDLDLHFRGGFLGRFAERRMGAAGVEKKVREEIGRFVALAERPDVHADPGDLMAVDSGAGFRTVQVLRADADVIHVALDSGVSKTKPSLPISAPPNQGLMPVTPTPLAGSISSALRKVKKGQPVFTLDGGHGVPHMALSRGVFIDSLPERIGHQRLPEGVDEELEAWSRLPDPPVFGSSLDMGLGPIVVMPLDEGFRVAKVLRTDRAAVHVRVYSDRFTEPPATVNPWSLRLDPITSDSPAIGHMPISLASWQSSRPAVVRLAMVGGFELEGVREWEAAGGGIFA